MKKALYFLFCVVFLVGCASGATIQYGDGARNKNVEQGSMRIIEKGMPAFKPVSRNIIAGKKLALILEKNGYGSSPIKNPVYKSLLTTELLKYGADVVNKQENADLLVRVSAEDNSTSKIVTLVLEEKGTGKFLASSSGEGRDYSSWENSSYYNRSSQEWSYVAFKAAIIRAVAALIE
jgi:hypothetical protein